ncbi:hypothetical protein GCM10022238_45470 [Gordonia hankookensis]
MVIDWSVPTGVMASPNEPGNVLRIDFCNAAKLFVNFFSTGTGGSSSRAICAGSGGNCGGHHGGEAAAALDVPTTTEHTTATAVRLTINFTRVTSVS